MSDTGRFAIDVAAFIAKAQGKGDMAARGIAVRMARDLVMGTPVDKGILKANWHFGSGSRPSEWFRVGDPDGGATVARLTGDIMNASVGRTTWYLVNNAPYAAVVEYGLYPNPPKHPTGKTEGGYSIQAPAGWVRIVVAQFQQYVLDSVAEAKAS